MKVGTRCKIITKYGENFLSLYDQLLKKLERESYDMEYRYIVDSEPFFDSCRSPNQDENMIRSTLVDLLEQDGFTVDNNRETHYITMFTVILRED